MNRRSFFTTLFGGYIAAVCPKPVPTIPVRKMLVRVHVTGEAMLGLNGGTAIRDLIHGECMGISRDMLAREERMLGL
jgi:hypothetical protein